MEECGITVANQTDVYRALTAPPMTAMTSLTLILSLYFVTNLAVAFSLHSNLQTEIVHAGYLTA
jgi:hypothetical protein